MKDAANKTMRELADDLRFIATEGGSPHNWPEFQSALLEIVDALDQRITELQERIGPNH